MKRLLIVSATAVAAAGLAVTPAVAGLAHNPSFSHQIPVRVPAGAQHVRLADDHGGRGEPEPGHGGYGRHHDDPTTHPSGSARPTTAKPTTSRPSATPTTDDRGGRRSGSGEPEPGDGRGSEPGDDNGSGHGGTHGGGHGGTHGHGADG